jgi:hypothetical protein
MDTWSDLQNPDTLCWLLEENNPSCATSRSGTFGQARDDPELLQVKRDIMQRGYRPENSGKTE